MIGLIIGTIVILIALVGVFKSAQQIGYDKARKELRQKHEREEEMTYVNRRFDDVYQELTRQQDELTRRIETERRELDQRIDGVFQELVRENATIIKGIRKTK